MNLIDLTPMIGDFADTTALVSHLDLVVSVDTAIVHLAGAMGKPVWVMLQYTPDFRWLLEGDTTLWYPSMRLIRQQTFGVWNDVIDRTAAELATLQAVPMPGELKASAGQCSGNATLRDAVGRWHWLRCRWPRGIGLPEGCNRRSGQSATRS